MKIIEYSQVKDVTEDGLTYTDKEGNDHSINFEEIYKKYLEPRITRDAYSDFQKHNPTRIESFEQFVERQKRRRVIAQRNVLGEQSGEIPGGLPWVKFHTEPTLVIRFANHHEYDRLLGQLRVNRWHTVDLT
ncbi:MAG: hypothetical protein AAFR22_26390 [Chloroflexota bacterium]